MELLRSYSLVVQLPNASGYPSSVNSSRQQLLVFLLRLWGVFFHNKRTFKKKFNFFLLVSSVGPAFAIPKVLQKAGISKDDVDFFEINEAFASQAVYCIDYLNIPYEKVNVRGGAIAIGHPLGCSTSTFFCFFFFIV